MAGKAYKSIDAICDALIVVLLQVAIVFVIILLPGTLTIVREASARGYNTLGDMSMSVMQDAIADNYGMQVLIRFARCIGFMLAPFLYELFRKKKTIAEEYIRGLKLDWKSFAKGLLWGVAFVALSVALTSIMALRFPDFGNALSRFPHDYFLPVIYSLLWCVAVEMFSRYYPYIKTSSVSKVLFVVLSCGLFIYSTIGFFPCMDVFSCLYLMLINLVLSLKMLNQEGASENIGFNMMVVMFFLFGIKACLEASPTGVIVVLAIVCGYELYRIRGHKKHEHGNET